MSKYLSVLTICLLSLNLSGLHATGSSTATATVTYTINSIDSIAVSGNPGPLNITTATAGSNPSSAVDSSTTFAVTSNNSSRKITASLASNMPPNITLSVDMVAPTGATSAGSIALDTTTQSLVTGIGNLAQGSLGITYILTATTSASPVTAATNTVTYTIAP